LPLSALGWADAGAVVSVRDLWARSDRGTSTGVINVTVAMHDIVVYQVAKKDCCVR
jgi:hypothetical protein